jgi:thymidine kinase
VAELTFLYGTMNCGKSAMALQMHHHRRLAGKRVLLYTLHTREEGVIASRIGIRHEATVVDEAFGFFADVKRHVLAGVVDEVFVDEAQFCTPAQVEDLAAVADQLGVEVWAFGLLTDFTTALFDGSRRLLELADTRREMPVEALCWCGRRATHNARTVDGHIVRGGDTVVVGDLGAGGIAYEVLCRAHHTEGVTRVVAASRPALAPTLGF